MFAHPRRKAFIPFFTLGDPDPDISYGLICEAVDSGADALELGFPFSDPITDGPVNQRSMKRSLDSGMTYDGCLKILARIRIKYPDLPIGLLLYYNLLHNRGDIAYREFSEIGVDAVVCSDLPYDESFDHVQRLEDVGVGCIQMIAPNTPRERAKILLERSSAFTYVISRFGTTGTRDSFDNVALERVLMLRRLSEKPIVVGFGISKIDHVRDFWNSGADGVIVGSLFSLCIERNLNNINTVRKFVGNFVSRLQRDRVHQRYLDIV